MIYNFLLVSLLIMVFYSEKLNIEILFFELFLINDESITDL